MADDKRSGETGFDDGAFGDEDLDREGFDDGALDRERVENGAVRDDARDQTGKEAVGHGDGHDAALGESPAASVSPDGADAGAAARAGVGTTDAAGADPIAAELSAVFAAALADEPPSRVTAESVLREVHGEQRRERGGFGSWLMSGSSLKWAGGLVAAAALVAAVVVAAPNMGGSADSATAAGSQVYESSADSSAGGEGMPQSAAAAADDAAGVATPEAAPMSGMSEMSASSESSQAAADSGGSSGQLEAASGDAADTPGGDASADRAASGEIPAEPSSAVPSSAASGSAVPSSEGPAGGESDAATSSGTDCSLTPLRPAEWSAAVAALPSDVATTRLPGALCAEGALRGNGIEFAGADGGPGGFLWIVVADTPLGRDGAASDSTVVSTSRGGATVTVIANQSGDPWLDEAALRRLADAVAAVSD